MGSMCVLQQFDHIRDCKAYHHGFLIQGDNNIQILFKTDLLSYSQYLNPDFKPHPLLCALHFLMSLRFLPSLFSYQRDETAST